jgi:hypothetical protein
MLELACRLRAEGDLFVRTAGARELCDQNRICKEIALQWPKTGKFDYLSALYQPAHSRGSEFFTDELLGGHKLGGLPRKERRPDQSLQQAIEAVRAQFRTLPFAALINAKH